jgi:hypothetical protein
MALLGCGLDVRRALRPMHPLGSVRRGFGLVLSVIDTADNDKVVCFHHCNTTQPFFSGRCILDGGLDSFSR